jgi:TonB family protein
MASTVTRVVIVVSFIGCIIAGGIWISREKFQQHLSPAELAVGRHVRAPGLPQVFTISCNGRDVPLGHQLETRRGGDWEMMAVTIEPACMPEGDFIFSVEATPQEFLTLAQAPSARFTITPKGAVREARILHPSGSKELDARILRLIEQRRFKVGCGECRVETTVNVEF